LKVRILPPQPFPPEADRRGIKPADFEKALAIHEAAPSFSIEPNLLDVQRKTINDERGLKRRILGPDEIYLNRLAL
jgi:hypothetical protein